MAAIQHQPRAHFARPSPFSAQYRSVGHHPAASATKHINVSDSESDDEPPPAIKFSKVTEALLNDRPIPSSPIKHDIDIPRALRSISASQANLDTPSRGIKIIRKSSPSALGGTGYGTTPPRVVHIGSAQDGSARRTVSISGPYPQLRTRRDMTPADEIVTPAQARQQTRTRPVGGEHNSSRPGSSNGRQTQDIDAKDLAASLNKASIVDTRYAPSTIGRTRNVDLAHPPASQRVKRAPIATGTFLKSGPVRRGFRRRESEENVSPIDGYNSGAASQPSSNYTPQGSTRGEGGMRSRSNSANTRATSVDPVSVHDFAHEKHASSSRPGSRQAYAATVRSQDDHGSRPASRQTSHEQLGVRQPSIERHRIPSSSQAPSSIEAQPRSSFEHARPPVEQKLHSLSLNPSYRHMTGRPHIDAMDDQENIPPPTFKRNKDQEFKYLGRPAAVPVMSDDDKPKQRTGMPASEAARQDRKALGSISSNTPHRPPPPPPPPKMSVLETATVTAGAATTKSRKKRTHVVINGKIFTQMGKIGKGGSSDVYCVMAENFKMFAMKKVKLEDCDENAVRGYKGEIDLLRKLTEVDRVVRLFDWELNEEKQELIVLMEKGDTDLNRVLTMKINGNDSKFDSAFTAFHWKEMLECVQAVHEHDIVHSDLKPANFLVVQGRLKLIDFGIANAIDIDNTCNVHRDSHVGTPNYMSPESITDTNASGPGYSSKDADGRPVKKDMRIGKSSDVWSLGCILYQMTYGRPPFAHIANQITRIMAITNPRHIIDFPDTGIGGNRVPASLKGILKRCLQRDADLRPTIPQLLSDSDSFLNPEADGAVLLRQEVLDQIINKVVDRCRDTRRGLPTAAEVAQYAPSFMLKIREMVEKA